MGRKDKLAAIMSFPSLESEGIGESLHEPGIEQLDALYWAAALVKS